MNVKGESFLIINVYAPCVGKPKEQVEFWNKLALTVSNIENVHNKNIVCGGDINFLMNIGLDRAGGNPRHDDNVVHAIKNFIDGFDLVDIWRVRNPYLRQYTWRQKNPLIQSRLDLWFVSNTLQDMVKNVGISPSISSDHSLIFVNIDNTLNNVRGPSYWKFNNSLCDDVEFCQAINSEALTWFDNYSNIDDKRLLWELIKYDIRKFSQSFSKSKAQKKRQHLKILEDNVKKSEIELGNHPSEENETVWNVAKEHLENEYNSITQGIIVRSRAQWVEMSEKNNKYFLSLEKANKVKSTINTLSLDDGDISTNQSTILKEIKTFYANLYSKKDVELNSGHANKFFTHSKIPKLNVEQQEICEGLLTMNECFEVLNSFQKGKTPGNDGLTVEFYKQFWQVFGKTLVDSLNTGYAKGELSNSQKQGVITLILKKEKDKRKISSYRPITLLNVDLKIGSKAIAKRVAKVLPDIIGIEQSAFVNERYIGDAVRTVADLILFTKYKNCPGILLNIDFEKAYDSIDHNFLAKVINSFNFGVSFQRWVNVFYNNIQSCVMNNGISTGYFPIKRGVRQGDPLSSILFVISMEVLLINIRENNDIRGININQGNTLKLSCYADDLTCFPGDIESAKNILQILDDFHSCSSLKVNVEKTEAMWLGSARNSSEKPLNLVWSESVKVLGIVFSYNEKFAYARNFEDKITSLKQTLTMWKNRDLTGIGKITIVKVFGLSKLLYTTSMITTPIEVQKKVNSIVHQFIWNGPDKIKRSELRASYEEGGLKMVDFSSRIKAQQSMWLKRYTDNESGWKKILDHYLSKFGGLKFLLKCSYNVKKLNGHIPQFYVNILNTFAELNSKHSVPDTSDGIGKQMIWNNGHVLINNKSVFYNHFYNSGIVTINDLFDVKGVRPFHDLGFKDCVNLNYLRWYGIIQAIPGSWRKKIVDGNNGQTDNANQDDNGYFFDGKFHALETTKSRKIYQQLIKNDTVIPKCMERLKNEYGLDMSIGKKLFLMPWRVTIDSRLRWLQFRINHFILPTNKWLHKIGIIASPNCLRCNSEIETLDHIFIHCPDVIEFWNKLHHKWIKLIGSDLSSIDKLFGIINDEDDWLLKNQILLMARRYICICKYRESPLSVRVFDILMRDTARLEETLARQRGNLGVHYMKWDKAGIYT